MAAPDPPPPGPAPEPPPPLDVVRRRGLGSLSVLPDDVLCYLLQWSALEVADLLRLSQCSRLLRVLVCEEPLWLRLHLERYRRRPFTYRVRGRLEQPAAAAPHPPCVCGVLGVFAAEPC